jgi:hypothetical protein
VRLGWQKQLQDRVFRISLRREVSVRSSNHDLCVWYPIKLIEENDRTRTTRLNMMRQSNRRAHDEIRNEEMEER